MSTPTQIEQSAKLLARQPLDVSNGTPGPMPLAKGGNALPQSFWLVLSCPVLLSLAAATGARAQVDRQALRQQHGDAIARGDVAEAWALDADEAVVDGGGPWTAAPGVGKAASQKPLERRVAETLSATGLSDSGAGPVVTTRLAVRTNAMPQAEGDRLMGWDIYADKGDKLASVHGPWWARPAPQTARFVEGQRAQQASRCRPRVVRSRHRATGRRAACPGGSGCAGKLPVEPCTPRYEAQRVQADRHAGVQSGEASGGQSARRLSPLPRLTMACSATALATG